MKNTERSGSGFLKKYRVYNPLRNSFRKKWSSKTKECPSSHAQGGYQNTLAMRTKYCLEGYLFDSHSYKKKIPKPRVGLS